MRSIFCILLIGLVIGQSKVAAQSNLTHLGHLFYPDGLSALWGYEDIAGNEYALVGVRTGTSIVDISTDPSNPNELFFLPGPYSIWREMKVWNQHAYVTNESGN